MNRLRHASWGKIGLVAITVLYILWSLAPVAIAFLFSFNAGYSRSTWQGFSTQWWSGPKSVFNEPIYTDAIRHSLLLAVLAVIITVPLGVSLSIFLSRWRGITARPASFLATVPLVVPELVLALALFFLVTKVNLPIISLGTSGQAVGQVTFILPLVIVITIGRLSSIPTGFEEAAQDLGASPLKSFRLVLVPAAAAGHRRERDRCVRRLDRRLRDHPVHVVDLVNPVGADADLHGHQRRGDTGAERDGHHHGSDHHRDRRASGSCSTGC